MFEFLRSVFDFLFWMLSRRTLLGAKNMPSSGGYLMIINHQSMVDIALLFTLLPHPRLSALVTTKYMENWFFNWLLTVTNIIWLRRGESDRAALKVAIERMHAGVLVGIAPEGTRSTTGGLLPGLPGAAFLAVHAGVPVLPVALLHTATAFGELKRLRRPHMVMKVGPAFTVPPLQPANRSAQLERITEEMMLRLAAMLPAARRGVYADHARLPEFIEWAKANGLAEPERNN